MIHIGTILSSALTHFIIIRTYIFPVLRLMHKAFFVKYNLVSI